MRIKEEREWISWNISEWMSSFILARLRLVSGAALRNAAQVVSAQLRGVEAGDGL